MGAKFDTTWEKSTVILAQAALYIIVSIIAGRKRKDEDLDDSDYDLDLVDSVDSVDWPVERFLAAPKASVVGWGFKFIWLKTKLTENKMEVTQHVFTIQGHE
ncbi:conserved hypothetical protein [Ricinus communis]|uniref:Uncharacterized protein n=1 Tax=Ricinus communis TaxID=3988 RepID=B9RDB4_RICCO|nr:conserved hypothetical protein [Ricinus communis]